VVVRTTTAIWHPFLLLVICKPDSNIIYINLRKMQTWDCVLFILSALTFLFKCTSRTMFAGPWRHRIYTYVQKFYPLHLIRLYAKIIVVDAWYSIKNILKNELSCANFKWRILHLPDKNYQASTTLLFKKKRS
jgi:hypothetical protein